MSLSFPVVPLGGTGSKFLRVSFAMRIYFIGICGTGMGNAALLMRELGHTVVGSDEAAYPPMCDVLEASGTEVLDGFEADRMVAWNPDLVVVGNAISRGNPEVECLLNKQTIPFVSLPAMLSEWVLPGRHAIVVAGTHGKTTTACLIAHLLWRAGTNPGFLIGGIPKDFESGCSLGGVDAPFVVEGDEYDSAFFDKRSKFVHYRPEILVLNNLEFDHADIFRDLDDVKRAFDHLLRVVPGQSWVVANGDDGNVTPLLKRSWLRVVRVGESEDNDLVIRDFQHSRGGSRFCLFWRGHQWCEVTSSLSGFHNARNSAMAVLATGLYLHPRNPTAFQPCALTDFGGVRRRQDVLIESEGIAVVEDFGHHPTAIKHTLQGLLELYGEVRSIVCLEPRSNTMRMNLFEADLADALHLADVVLIGPVYRREHLPDQRRLNRRRLVEQLVRNGGSAHSFATFDDLLSSLIELTKQRQPATRDLVVFFTNGSFGGIVGRYVASVSFETGKSQPAASSAPRTNHR